MKYHPLAHKIFEFHAIPPKRYEEADQIIRQWLSEKAEDLAVRHMGGEKYVNFALELTEEKSLEEKFMNEPAPIFADTHCDSWEDYAKRLADIARRHYETQRP